MLAKKELLQKKRELRYTIRFQTKLMYCAAESGNEQAYDRFCAGLLELEKEKAAIEGQLREMEEEKEVGIWRNLFAFCYLKG